MRGIGFTVQTTDPQSASCPAFLQSALLHTQLLVCVMFVYELHVWGWWTHKLTQKEVPAEMQFAFANKQYWQHTKATHKKNND